jgi:hypothetical protein
MTKSTSWIYAMLVLCFAEEISSEWFRQDRFRPSAAGVAESLARWNRTPFAVW